jgi:endonuclease YncB( thermonuclease family)
MPPNGGRHASTQGADLVLRTDGGPELRSHIGGRELTCARHGVDRYNRILATCTVPDGFRHQCLDHRQGWAVASGDAGHYRSEQHEAEAARRGIWSGTFLLPREWRRQHPE